MRSTQLQLNMLRIYKAKGDWEAFVRHLKIDLEEEEEEAEGFEDDSIGSLYFPTITLPLSLGHRR